jgi:hypothetical protein
MVPPSRKLQIKTLFTTIPQPWMTRSLVFRPAHGNSPSIKILLAFLMSMYVTVGLQVRVYKVSSNWHKVTFTVAISSMRETLGRHQICTIEQGHSVGSVGRGPAGQRVPAISSSAPGP